MSRPNRDHSAKEDPRESPYTYSGHPDPLFNSKETFEGATYLAQAQSYLFNINPLEVPLSEAVQTLTSAHLAPSNQLLARLIQNHLYAHHETIRVVSTSVQPYEALTTLTGTKMPDASGLGLEARFYGVIFKVTEDNLDTFCKHKGYSNELLGVTFEGSVRTITLPDGSRVRVCTPPFCLVRVQDPAQSFDARNPDYQTYLHESDHLFDNMIQPRNAIRAAEQIEHQTLAEAQADITDGRPLHLVLDRAEAPFLPEGKQRLPWEERALATTIQAYHCVQAEECLQGLDHARTGFFKRELDHRTYEQLKTQLHNERRTHTQNVKEALSDARNLINARNQACSAIKGAKRQGMMRMLIANSIRLTHHLEDIEPVLEAVGEEFVKRGRKVPPLFLR